MTDALFIASNVLLKGTPGYCLDQYQVKRACHIDYKPSEDDELIDICKKKSFIYLPILINGNHWILIIINTIKNTIQTYDPRKPIVANHELIKQAEKFYNELEYKWNDTKTNFKSEVNYSLPLQRDNYNCGVLVTYAIDVTSNNKTIPEITDKKREVYLKAMTKYRISLKKLYYKNQTPHYKIVYFV